MKTLSHRVLCVFGLVALIASVMPSRLLAQGAEPSDLPFLALVVSEQAELRAGPGKAYYTVGRLMRNDVVEVHDAMLGWYKVAPPEGVYSYVSKAFVKASGDGTVGEIVEDRVTVKAASEKGPGWSFKSQATLERGAEVTIVGEDGSYYRILPPEAARVFIERDVLRPASAAELEALRQAGEREIPTLEPTDPEPAEPEVAEPVATEPEAMTPVTEEPMVVPAEPETAVSRGPLIPAEPTKPVMEEPVAAEVEASAVAEAEPETVATPDQEPVTMMPVEPVLEGEGAWPVIGKSSVGVPTQAEAVSLTAVERVMRPKFAMPLDEMPLDEMKQAYEGLSEDVTLTAQDRQIVEIRLIAIARNRQLRDRLRAEAEVEAMAEAEPAEPVVVEATPEEGAVPVVVRSDESAPVEDYAFVGQLLQSSLYDGEDGRPSLLRLVDPTTRRTLGYIVAGSISDRRAISSLVGIIGKRHRNENLGILVIEPEQIDMLSVRP